MQTCKHKGLFGKGLSLYLKGQNLHLYKLRATADDKFIIKQKMKFAFSMVKKKLGKGKMQLISIDDEIFYNKNDILRIFLEHE